jgi:hypothetical protein
MALACLALPGPALGASLTLDAYFGAQNIGNLGVDTARSASPNALGGSALLAIEGFAVGLGIEQGTRSLAFSPSALTVYALAGFVADALSAVRLELLGEIGKRDLQSLDEISLRNLNVAPGRETYIGLRPGISTRVPLFPFRLGVSGVARWGLAGGQPGSPTYGLVARMGVEL